MEKLLDFTKPHLLRSPEEYAAAIQAIDALMDRNPPPGTEEYERLEFLAVLAEAYEDEHFVEDETLPFPVVVSCRSQMVSRRETHRLFR